jgi:hypothetical protein
MLAKRRDEDPQVEAKTIRSGSVVRKFEKNNSVFKDWKEDTE